jgi:hypothetical protein
MSEPLMTLLAGLPLADPDRGRADQTNARCRARLVRARASKTSTRISSRTHLAVWKPVIATLAIAYVANAIVLAIRIYATP